MSKIKKLLMNLLALVMIVGMFMPITAKAEATKTNTVTLHKLLMNETDLDNWNHPAAYDGTQDLAKLQALMPGKTLKEIPNVYFAVQNEQGKWVKGDGTVVNSAAEALGGLTKDGGLELDVKNLPQAASGTKYLIVEVKELSTYVGPDSATLSRMRAVPVEITLPLVNNAGIQESVHVYPKNTEIGKPDNKKKIDTTVGNGATIDGNKSVTIGDKVPYEVTTTVKAGSTYNKVAWSDQLSKGLKLNQDVVLTSNPDIGLIATDYDLTYTENSFTLVFKKEGLTKLAQKTAPADAKFKVLGQDPEINGANQEVVFALKYSAEVTEDAVIRNPLENTNTFHYGNNPGYTPEPGDNNPKEIPNVTEINVDKKISKDGKAVSTDGDWPVGKEFKFQLQEYNADTNTWVEATSVQPASTMTLNQGQQTGQFTGLDAKKVYKVIEIEDPNYVPNYDLVNGNTVKIVNKKNDNPKPITPEPVTIRTYGKKFVKTSEVETERLGGAEFVVLNADGTKYLGQKSTNDKPAYEAAEAAYQEAIKKLNTLKAKNPQDPADQPEITKLEGEDTVTGSIKNLKKTRDAAFVAMNMQWEWKDTQGDAFKFITNQDGQWEVVGLAEGTYKYLETKSPDGYAKNDNQVEFTVNATSYDQNGDIAYDKVAGETDATRIRNKKVTIPQTGGIGSLIFVAVGLVLMGVAVIEMKKGNKREVA